MWNLSVEHCFRMCLFGEVDSFLSVEKPKCNTAQYHVNVSINSIKAKISGTSLLVCFVCGSLTGVKNLKRRRMVIKTLT